MSDILPLDHFVINTFFQAYSQNMTEARVELGSPHAMVFLEC